VTIWLPFGAGGDEISTSWEKPIPKQGQIMLMPIYCDADAVTVLDGNADL